MHKIKMFCIYRICRLEFWNLHVHIDIYLCFNSSCSPLSYCQIMIAFLS